MYWSSYWGMHVFWWFFWIVLVVLLASTGWPRSHVNARDGAIETLRSRYAAGEIDEAEYRERLGVLRGAKRSDLVGRGEDGGKTDDRAPPQQPR
jgi:putative membrane protein